MVIKRFGKIREIIRMFRRLKMISKDQKVNELVNNENKLKKIEKLLKE